MSIDFQQVADAIEKSSWDIKNLMFSTEIGDEVKKITEENKIDPENSFKIADEISYVILGLKQRSSFLDSLKKIGIENIIAEKILKDVEYEIFSELDKINNRQTNNIDNAQKPKQEKNEGKQSGVGQSFEEIIMNQAKAMQPAKESEQIPKIHDYNQGEDPYREAI